MTIREVIAEVKAMRNPAAEESELLRVITRTEHELYKTIISPRMEYEFEAYGHEDMETTLQAAPPFDRLYVIACLRYIDQRENQITNMNNEEREYKEILGEFAAWYIRNYRPAASPNMRSAWYGI